MDQIYIEKVRRTGSYAMAALHSHNNYELCFLLEGTRKLFIRDSLYVVQKNMFIMIPPFVLHKTEGGPYTRINLNFLESFFTEDEAEFLEAVCEQQILALNDANKDFFIRLLNELLKYQQNGGAMNEALFRITAKKLIAELYEIREESQLSDKKKPFNKDTPSVVTDILQYINENYAHKISMSDISKRFYLSRGHIAKLFQKYAGFSLSYYLTNLRLNKAKQMLAASKKSIDQISEECGFNSANYFSLTFKTRYSLSPSDYRKNSKNYMDNTSPL